MRMKGKTPPVSLDLLERLDGGPAADGGSGGWQEGRAVQLASAMEEEGGPAAARGIGPGVSRPRHDAARPALATWQRTYLLGREPGCRAVPGKLSWYQPWGCCHWIAFFSMAIGVLNYPRLDWRFVSGDLHTVPVGSGPDGKPAMVMDILLFEGMTAQQSLALAMKKLIRAPAATGWDKGFQMFVGTMVPALRAVAGVHPPPVAAG